jgi:hypothetical protein
MKQPQQHLNNRLLFKSECEDILPFVNALQAKIKSQIATKQDISIFITLVKDILMEKRTNDRI